MKKEYLALTYYIPENFQELAHSVFYEYDFTGIETNSENITINFFAKKNNEVLKKEILNKLKSIDTNIELIDSKIIEEKNWNEEWEKTLEPVFISDEIVIVPNSNSSKFDNFRYKIQINPKMSFGTGYHATTRMISSMMANSVKNGETWVDAGTGTGVLAILASMLGASKVYAFDNDEWSVINAEENMKINERNNIELIKSEIDNYSFPSADGLLANLFSNIIVKSLDSFYNSLYQNKGTLICTGILNKDKEYVKRAAKDTGFYLIEEQNEDEWTALKFGIRN